MSRTGLAAEVPSLELCREMAAIPAFVEPFRETTLVWLDDGEHGIGLTERESVDEDIPAPTVREMLAWLRLELGSEPVGYDGCNHYIETWNGRQIDLDIITDPDALARACIEAAK